MAVTVASEVSVHRMVRFGLLGMRLHPAKIMDKHGMAARLGRHLFEWPAAMFKSKIIACFYLGFLFVIQPRG